MEDYRRLPPIIIFPRRKFSHCPIFHPIFHRTIQSVRQWDSGLSFLQGKQENVFIKKLGKVRKNCHSEGKLKIVLQITSKKLIFRVFSLHILSQNVSFCYTADKLESGKQCISGKMKTLTLRPSC